MYEFTEASMAATKIQRAIDDAEDDFEDEDCTPRDYVQLSLSDARQILAVLKATQRMQEAFSFLGREIPLHED